MRAENVVKECSRPRFVVVLAASKSFNDRLIEVLVSELKDVVQLMANFDNAHMTRWRLLPGTWRLAASIPTINQLTNHLDHGLMRLLTNSPVSSMCVSPTILITHMRLLLCTIAMRLLMRNVTSTLIFRTFNSNNLPAYVIPTHSLFIRTTITDLPITANFSLVGSPRTNHERHVSQGLSSSKKCS
jgi:hypothetical protein